MAYFAYVLHNPEGRYYIGQTSDLRLRLRRHNEGRVFWTKGRGPWELLASKEFSTRGQAVREEKKLKALKNKRTVEVRVARW